MLIKVSEFTKNAYSKGDAEKVRKFIDIGIEKGETSICVDFEGITLFTTLFFNNCFVDLIGTLGEDAYNSKINIINLTGLGQEIYDKSYRNAVSYYKNPKQSEENIRKLFEI